MALPDAGAAGTIAGRTGLHRDPPNRRRRRRGGIDLRRPDRVQRMSAAGENPLRSPLSDRAPVRVRDLPKPFLLERLEEYYGEKPPPELVATDYALWRCAETGLEFAWPMQPGSARFYEWISRFPSYYPGIRWEYNQVMEVLKVSGKTPPADFRILDVGCGTGDFLRGLNGLGAAHRYALDLNEPAIRICSEQGFQAFCGTIDSAKQAGFVGPRIFPAVTSFHC